jgi:carboxymethylenebutenolidase
MARPEDRTITITAVDGGTSDGWLWLPPAGAGPGILLIQEIFGVGPFLRAKAADLADLGYVVLAPDLFWRTERHVAHDHDEAGLQAAFSSVTTWGESVDDATKASDAVAALAALRATPEVGGRRAGVLGYCLGGRMAYELAVHGDPDTCVSYYGSGIGSRLDDAGRITCPVLFQYGSDDPYIPTTEVDAVRDAFADRDDVEVVVHDGAGHAFENFEAPMFHDAAAARSSWERTVAFLARTLPVG